MEGIFLLYILGGHVNILLIAEQGASVEFSSVAVNGLTTIVRKCSLSIFKNFHVEYFQISHSLFQICGLRSCESICELD